MQVYKHLSAEERTKIAFLQEDGFSQSEIAEELGRHRSTISREIRRNSCGEAEIYAARTANSAYKKRITQPQGRIRDEQTKAYVIEKLNARWTPERICGRMVHELPGKYASVETIYMFLYNERRDLLVKLARHHIKRHKRGQRKSHNKSHIKYRVLVDARSEAINNREETGHWESDTMEGLKTKHSGLTLMIERKTRYTKIRKLKRITALNNGRNIRQIMRQIPSEARNSITYDNGHENAYHYKINKDLNCRSFFCHDGKPYEKGTVENTIGLARRIYPKGTDFDTISVKKIQELEDWLNDMPKKCLGWKTPREAFNQLCCT